VLVDLSHPPGLLIFSVQLYKVLQSQHFQASETDLFL
jgi:hypothetical protein